MNQKIEVDSREVQITGIIQLFEDRLTGRPGSESWEELSGLLDGASAWRDELNKRWGDRPDWKAFLEWEAERRAARKKQIRVRVGHWQAIVKEVDENRLEVIWFNPCGTLTKGTAVKIDDSWGWDDEIADSEIHLAVPREGLQAVCVAASNWFAGPVRQVVNEA